MENNIEKVLKTLNPEKAKDVLEELINCISHKKEKENFPFKIKEYKKFNTSVPYLTYKDIKNLRYDDTVSTINRNMIISIKGTLKHCINVDISGRNDNIAGKIFMSKGDSNSFIKEFEGCTVLCNSDISYSPTLECFSISNLIVYKHIEPLKEWFELLKGKNLSERIDTILKIIGLNPEVLLYHEKITVIGRLLPLVVKKFLLLDISKKELGKTQTYVSLGFEPYTLMLSRANIIADGRSGKEGAFFREKTVFILDELNKIDNDALITAFQIYMNGEKYKGIIVINDTNKKETDISLVILGNIKSKENLLDLYKNKKNLFEDTIIMTSPDGEAFISRITALLNSWGCRTFSPDMKLETENASYNRSLLKAAFIQMREKEFNINLFQEALGIRWKSSSMRTQDSIEKSFEGFVKILFPEYIDNPNFYQIKKLEKEFLFLYERAMEFRKTVDNQLKIINPNDNKDETLPPLSSDLKGVMFKIEKKHFFTAHRLFINLENENIAKVALDCMGIELNKKEAELLNKRNLFSHLNDNGTILTHSLKDKRNNLSIQWNSQSWNWSSQNLQTYSQNFNFLTGENEIIEENFLNDFNSFSFYDLT